MCRWVCGLALSVMAVALTATTPAGAIQAGITLDVHQDIQDPALWPNDFHIEGLICSHGLTPPALINVLSDIFGPASFTYTITYLGDGDCWYWFTADWAFPPGTNYIPYCTVLHLGLLFDVDAANVVIDLIGWWTRDGMPVGHILGELVNRGFVPLIGFSVADTGLPQIMTVGSGDLPITPPLPLPPNPPPWPPIAPEMWVLQMEVVPFPPGPAPDFNELRESGQQQFWPWIPVTFGDGTPIGPSRPLHIGPSSFFDIFLSVAPPGADQLGVQAPFTIEPGGFLAARQRVVFVNNSGQFEERWFWDIHGAQGTEACCLPDGACQDLPPFTCLQLGGQPMGPGTSCWTVQCPIAPGACCYPDGSCIIQLPNECAAGGGVFQGAGTTCVPNPCPPLPIEACCMPDGMCLMLPQAECVAHGGTWMGPGSRCLGDLNGNGLDDLCEAKWLQQPDLTTMGIDVKASIPLLLADDFLCTQRSLITEIAVWGSWKNDYLPFGDPARVRFTLSLHADIPDPDGEQGPLYSMPGPALWLHTFEPSQFLVHPYQPGLQEGWWDPAVPNSYVFPGDTVCWLYFFQVPPHEAFCQHGSATDPIVYWLDVQAQPMHPEAQFGWKTSFQHWNDAGVWGLGPEPYPGPWNELRYPVQHPYHPHKIDLAFALNGPPCPDPIGACCLADYSCVEVPEAECLDLHGRFLGIGTICVGPETCGCKGDCNCDGLIDFDDINPFVAALSGVPPCNFYNCDINDDGAIDFDDISPFVGLLSSGAQCQ